MKNKSMLEYVDFLEEELLKLKEKLKDSQAIISMYEKNYILVESEIKDRDQLLHAYEKTADFSRQELQDLDRMVNAYEKTQKLASEEMIDSERQKLELSRDKEELTKEVLSKNLELSERIGILVHMNEISQYIQELEFINLKQFLNNALYYLTVKLSAFYFSVNFNLINRQEEEDKFYKIYHDHPQKPLPDDYKNAFMRIETRIFHQPSGEHELNYQEYLDYLLVDFPVYFKNELQGCFFAIFEKKDDKIIHDLLPMVQNLLSIKLRLIHAQESRIDEMGRVSQSYSRFVPRQFLRYLGRDSIEQVKLGDQVQKVMNLLFSDIRSFTTLSEKMTPQENFNFLNSYLMRIGPVIRKNNGFIDKYIGDAIMALFPDSPEDSLRAAIEMQSKIVEYNEHRKNQNYQPIAIGVGLHRGNLMLGTIGEENRMDTTVISDAVNVASRIESMNKFYGSQILVSGDFIDSLINPVNYHFRFLDRVKLKGKNSAISVFEILDSLEEKEFLTVWENKGQFEKAIQYYQNKEIQEAHILFSELFRKNPKDLAAGLYVKRCAKYLEDGVPEGWDAVETIEFK